jgi:hypothetical protein
MVEIGVLIPDKELPVRRTSDSLRKDAAVRARTQLIGSQIVIIQEHCSGERAALIRIHRQALLEIERLRVKRG